MGGIVHASTVIMAVFALMDCREFALRFPVARVGLTSLAPPVPALILLGEGAARGSKNRSGWNHVLPSRQELDTRLAALKVKRGGIWQ